MNSLLLAYLMFRAGLVLRVIAIVGLVGGPLLTVSAVGVWFALYGPGAHAISAVQAFAHHRSRLSRPLTWNSRGPVSRCG
jgi:hypothetical protein